MEVRLFDGKRRLLRVGDTVLFRAEDGETLSAKVAALHRADSFRALFSDRELLEKAGWRGATPSRAAEDMRRYYSAEEEARWGVLGIELLV